MPSSMKSAIEAAGRRDRLLREETKEDGAQPSCGAEERRPGHVTSAALGAVRSRSSKPCLAADRVEVAGRESTFERSVEPAMALRIRCHLLRALACARSHSAFSRLCFSLPATDTSAPAPLVGPAPSASGVPFMLLCGAMHSLRLAVMRSRFTFSSDGAQRGAKQSFARGRSVPYSQRD